jgi:hypothetical protein
MGPHVGYPELVGLAAHAAFGLGALRAAVDPAGPRTQMTRFEGLNKIVVLHIQLTMGGDIKRFKVQGSRSKANPKTFGFFTFAP